LRIIFTAIELCLSSLKVMPVATFGVSVYSPRCFGSQSAPPTGFERGSYTPPITGAKTTDLRGR
jgi:hypothetical protein